MLKKKAIFTLNEVNVNYMQTFMSKLTSSKNHLDKVNKLSYLIVIFLKPTIFFTILSIFSQKR